jgi:hypothetical protein
MDTENVGAKRRRRSLNAYKRKSQRLAETTTRIPLTDLTNVPCLFSTIPPKKSVGELQSTIALTLSLSENELLPYFVLFFVTSYSSVFSDRQICWKSETRISHCIKIFLHSLRRRPIFSSHAHIMFFSFR